MGDEDTPTAAHEWADDLERTTARGAGRRRAATDDSPGVGDGPGGPGPGGTAPSGVHGSGTAVTSTTAPRGPAADRNAPADSDRDARADADRDATDADGRDPGADATGHA